MHKKQEGRAVTNEIVSREYKIFREEERLRTIPRTMYEKACKITNKILKVEPDKATRKRLQEAIEFSHLRVTPEEVASLTILFTFFVCFPTLISIILKSWFGLPGLSVGFGLIIFMLSCPFAYYLYMYPLHLKKSYEMKAGNEIVMLILYMAMYMRNVPSLEGAVRFASENLSGLLGFELKKLMWDVEIGNYRTIQQALIDYSNKWKRNKEFVEAIEIMITSLAQVGSRRIEMLDEAVSIVLEGNREDAKHYNQRLKMPVTIVHALGIILPAMGLVMFPIVGVFLGVEPAILFIGYDVILPLVLFFIINHILEQRPATFSKIDISENPNAAPNGKFLLGKKAISAWPIGLIIGGIVFCIGIFLFMISTGEKIIESMIILFGFVLGISVYYMLVSFQNMRIREKTRETENEFGEALFQLGSHVRGGVPLELAIEHSIKRIGELSIKNLFQRALDNMRNLGLTFEQAFFDKEGGAIKLYPSKLIKSVMRTIVESSKKGVEVASVAMLSVSKYLKGIHQTQEQVKDELNDILNSLKFQAFFLSPFISGIIVTLAIIIIRILEQLTEKMAAFGSQQMLGFMTSFKEINLTPADFIFMVGVYVIETGLLLSMFINGIENGEDPIGRQNITAYTLLIGFIIFMIAVMVSLQIFGPLITTALV